MTTVKAFRYDELPDSELARLLKDGYARLSDPDEDNVQNRITDLQPSITEAVRRLNLKRRTP